MVADLASLPLTGFAPDNASIAAHLRQQADWLEEADATPVRTVFLIFEDADGSLRRQTCGIPCDLARAVGVITMSLQRSMLREAE
jgi:hypothetical protein